MKQAILWIWIFVPMLMWAQTPCWEQDVTSNAQIVYGTATMTHSDSLEAQAQAIVVAKEQIRTQLTAQLRHVAATYITEYNSPDSHNDVVKALKRMEAAADRVMDQTTTQCVQITIDEDNQYAASVVEQLQVESVFRYIAANYNDRIISIERFRDIYTNNLQYDDTHL